MSVLVVVAHPDDEVLGFAGVIARSVAEGRAVRVVVATNGDAWRGPDYGRRRQAESRAGLELLGVRGDAIRFLGYPDNGLERVRWVRRWRLVGELRRLAARADEIYTHVPFDGHADHAALARLMLEAAPGAQVWGTLMHPPGAGSCLELSASRWPGPAGEPAARFLPGADIEAPPSPACDPEPARTSWGPLGAPHDRREVPAEMQVADEAANLKWLAIACHRSQVEVSDISAGYLRAFVRRHEHLWRLAP